VISEKRSSDILTVKITEYFYAVIVVGQNG